MVTCNLLEDQELILEVEDQELILEGQELILEDQELILEVEDQELILEDQELILEDQELILEDQERPHLVSEISALPNSYLKYSWASCCIVLTAGNYRVHFN